MPSRELQTNNSEPVSQHDSPLRMKPSQHCGPLGSTQRSPRRTYPQAIPQGNLHRVRWALEATRYRATAVAAQQRETTERTGGHNHCGYRCPT